MKENTKNLMIGFVIIFAGIIALLVNMGVLTRVHEIFRGILFIIAGIIFHRLYIKQKTWAIIPAITLYILGALLILKSVFMLSSNILGVAILWSLAISTIIVYIKKQHLWWLALIAGILITLGTNALLEFLQLLPNKLVNIIFFIGTGLTFLYLWFTRTTNLKWTLFPALGCFLLAIYLYIDYSSWQRWDILFSFGLIIVGTYLLYNAIKK